MHVNEMDSHTHLAAGIDIGGTNTVVGVVSRDGALLASTSLSTRSYPVAEDYADAVCGLIDGLLEGIPDHVLDGVGIGAPNGVMTLGIIDRAPNLRFVSRATGERLDRIPLAAMVSERLRGVNVYMTNDANAAALGEMLFGGARGMRNFVVITLGTGLGSGFVTDGHLLLGHRSTAGELGHMTVVPGGRECPCGKRGCLERYASATGLCLTARELAAASDTESPLLSENTMAKDIYQAALDGDRTAIEAFRQTGRWLAMGIAAAVAVTQPQAVFLFGGMALSGKMILDPVQEYLPEFIYPPFLEGLEVRLSSLSENSAAVMGAAALVYGNGN